MHPAAARAAHRRLVGDLAADETGHSLWEVEDADFAAALERFAADLARRGGQAEPAAPDKGAKTEGTKKS